MELNPKKIYEELCNRNLNKSSAVDLLISIIENYDDYQIRLGSIKILDKIGVDNDKIFKLFENLIISDSNDKIRNASIKLLYSNFHDKAILPIKWAINHESSYECLISIIEILTKIQTNESKDILIKQLKNIRKIKYLNIEKKYENKKYRKFLKKLFKSKNFDNWTHHQLSKILINFLTIKHLLEKYTNVYFEFNPQTGLVEELDLSDFLEYEVKGTPWGWKNNIEKLSEISGLENLLNLHKINLSNNNIKDLKEFIGIKGLTHLDLSNNKLSDPKNIEYLKQLPNLEFIDLRANEIAKIINVSDLNPKIKILKESYLEKRFEKIK